MNVARVAPERLKAGLHGGDETTATSLARRTGSSTMVSTRGDLHRLSYRGGRTIASLWYRNIYVASDAWSREELDFIDTTLELALRDAELNKVIQQYFVTPISTVFLGRDTLGRGSPSIASHTSIQTAIRRGFEQGELEASDFPNSVFNFILPRGTVLVYEFEPDDVVPAGTAGSFESRGTSLQGLAGFHGSVHAVVSGQHVTIYYSVAVYSDRGNGIPAFDAPWKNIVATLYHNLCEARTNPDVADVQRGVLPVSALGWISDSGLECGDLALATELGSDQVFVELSRPGRVSLPVQLQYSNREGGVRRPSAVIHS